MKRSLDREAVRRQMGCATEKTAAASACAKQHAMGRYFLKRWETQRVSKPVGPIHVGLKSHVQTDGRPLLSITDVVRSG